MVVDPVAFFHEHYAGKITTRSHLAKEDSGLYAKLGELGKLDVVLPDAQTHRDFSVVDPVALFRERYAGWYIARRVVCRG